MPPRTFLTLLVLLAACSHDGWLTVSKTRKGDRLDSPIRSTKTGKMKRLPVPIPLQEWIAEHVERTGRLRAEPIFTVPWSGRGIRLRCSKDDIPRGVVASGLIGPREPACST